MLAHIFDIIIFATIIVRIHLGLTNNSLFYASQIFNIIVYYNACHFLDSCIRHLICVYVTCATNIARVSVKTTAGVPTELVMTCAPV